MRTVNNLKCFCALCLSLLFFGVHAQQKSGSKAPFVRIYNLEGKKFRKGRVAGVTDQLILLRKGEDNIEVDITQVGFIRTKHSVGNNVLIGASVGSAIAAVTFAAEADPDAWIFGYTAAEGVLAGFILGAPLGGGIGALTALFKKSEEYEIDGRQEEWMKIMPYFQRSDPTE